MASFECIFAKTDTDETNDKVSHCVKTVQKCRFRYAYIIRDLELHYIHRRQTIETLMLNSNQEI